MEHQPETVRKYCKALQKLEKITSKCFGLVDWKIRDFEKTIEDEEISLICPYCGAYSKLIDSKLIYGVSYGMAYVCKNYPECDTYVGTHKGTIKPRGTLANKELRKCEASPAYAFSKRRELPGSSTAATWVLRNLRRREFGCFQPY